MAGNNLVQALDRGLEILEWIAASPKGSTATEVAHHLRVKTPTAFNLLRTLVARGFLSKSSQSSRYTLGESVMALVHTHRQQAWRYAAEKILLFVFEAMNGQVNVILAEPMSADVYVTLRLDPTRPRLVEKPLGQTMMPYSTATGLCHLAFWPELERQSCMGRYPFEDFGAVHWQTTARLVGFLEATRTLGYVAQPQASRMRAAFPLFHPSGEFVGSLGASQTVEAQEIDFDLLVATLKEATTQLMDQMT